MQSKVCRTSPTLTQSKDQRFDRVRIMRKRTADPRAAYGAAQADLLPIKYMVCVYAQDCARFGLQPEQRCSAQRTVLCPKKQTTGGGHDAYFFTQ